MHKSTIFAAMAVAPLLISACGSDPGTTSPFVQNDSGVQWADDDTTVADQGIVATSDTYLAPQMGYDDAGSGVDPDAADPTSPHTCESGAVQSCASAQPDVCDDGFQTCGPDGRWGPCVSESLDAAPEQCANNLDDDCDGKVDANDPDCQECTPSATQACQTTSMGACAAGTQACELKSGGTWAWGPCESLVVPGSRPEDCAGNVDQDCDGYAPDVDSDCFCINGARDGDESDVDCGGSCTKCNTGALCVAPVDCASGKCSVPTPYGGCLSTETPVGNDIRDGKLRVFCKNNITSVQLSREVSITGTTMEGGCQSNEKTLSAYVRPDGKLMARCQQMIEFPALSLVSSIISIIKQPLIVERELVLHGATVSTTCTSPNTSGFIWQSNGKLLATCLQTLKILFSTTTKTVLTEIGIGGPSTCQ